MGFDTRVTEGKIRSGPIGKDTTPGITRHTRIHLLKNSGDKKGVLATLKILGFHCDVIWSPGKWDGDNEIPSKDPGNASKPLRKQTHSPILFGNPRLPPS